MEIQPHVFRGLTLTRKEDEERNGDGFTLFGEKNHGFKRYLIQLLSDERIDLCCRKYLGVYTCYS